MNPVRRRRLLWVIALVVAAGIATTLVAMALQRNIAYLYTPSEVIRGEAGGHDQGDDPEQAAATNGIHAGSTLEVCSAGGSASG